MDQPTIGKKRQRELFLSQICDRLNRDPMRVQELAARQYGAQRPFWFGGLLVAGKFKSGQFSVSGTVYAVFPWACAAKSGTIQAQVVIPPLEDRETWPKEELDRGLEGVVRQLMDSLCKNMPANGDAPYLRQWADKLYPLKEVLPATHPGPSIRAAEIMALFQAGVKKTGAPENRASIIVQIQEQLTNEARRRMPNYESDGWSVLQLKDIILSPAGPTRFELEISIAVMGKTAYKATSVSRPIGFRPEWFWMPPDAAASAIEESVQAALVWSVVDILGEFPLLLREARRSDLVNQALKNCKFGYGPISVEFAQIGGTEHGGYIVYKTDGADKGFTALAAGNPLDSGALLPIERFGHDEPYSIYTHKRLPASVFEFEVFAKEASRLYQNTRPGNKTEYPAIRVLVSGNGKDVSFQYKTRAASKWESLRLRKPELFMEARLRSIFDSALSLAESKNRQELGWAKSVAQMNEVHLGILKLLARRGALHLTAIRSGLSKKTKASEEGIAFFLHELCRERGLVQVRRRQNQHGYYDTYKLAKEFPKELLKKAGPRPFRYDELQHLKLKDRKALLFRMLSEAEDDKSRWEGLRTLENQARSLIVEFAKSDAGAAFFSSMTGDDAVYAKLLLESLPNCKRVAEKIFPEA